MNDNDNDKAKLAVDTIEYIDRRIHELEKRLDLKIGALDDKYEKSEITTALAQEAIDSHFKLTNEYQSRLDRLAATFTTAKDVDSKISLAIIGINLQIKFLWMLAISVVLIIIAAYFHE